MNNKKIILRVIVIAFVALVFLGISAFLIDKSYFWGDSLEEVNTHFEPKDILIYSVSGLAFIGTIIFVYVTFEVNKNAVDISNRMLKIEEQKNEPCVDVVLLTESEYLAIRYADRQMSFNILRMISGSITTSVNQYNGYNFLIKNITDNYIYCIVLKGIKIDKIDQNGNVLDNIIYHIENLEYVSDTNAYLNSNEERYMTIEGNLFDFLSFDYLRYELTFELYGKNKKFIEKIIFDTQNSKSFIFQKNKYIDLNEAS